MSERPRLLAMRALYDLRVVRAPIVHDGYSALLWTDDAEAVGVPGRPDVLDYRLTSRGRDLARVAFEEGST